MNCGHAVPPRRVTVPAALTAVLAGIVLLAAACGGGSGAAGSNSNSPKPLAQVLDAYMQCLHKHGELGAYFVHAPSSASPSTLVFHGYEIEGADVTSPQFQSAMQPCQHILAQIGTPPSAALLHQQLENSVKSANCMHAHGYPEWPEPKVIDGRVAHGVPSGLDVNSTQFQAVARICHPDVVDDGR
jgi:hypothetical protein